MQYWCFCKILSHADVLKNVKTSRQLEPAKVKETKVNECHIKVNVDNVASTIPSTCSAESRYMEKYLDTYWDKQLQYLICYGFPLDFDKQVKFPDSIPPSDRRWANVGTSVGPTLAADVGPTAF